jgi:superoxide dismutase, Fe-Mn family
MLTLQSYKPQQFNLSGLKGISDQTLEMHFKLYEGYVQNTNVLTEKITEIFHPSRVILSFPWMDR